MERLAISEMTTYRWSFEEDVQNYAAAGVGGIGVWRQKLSDFGEARGIELLRESGLSVSSLLWAGGFTGSDGRTYKDSIDDAKEAIQLSAELAANCLIVYTGARGGHTHNHARRLIKGALDELVPIATQANVTLALEPMHPGCAGDWTFLTDLNDALALIDSVGSSHLKLTFDTYQFGHDPAIIERFGELVPQMALVQFGDAKGPPQGEQNRCMIGQGTIPLRKIVDGLVAAGYQGPYEVELMGEEIETANYEEILAQSKQFVGEILS